VTPFDIVLGELSHSFACSFGGDVTYLYVTVALHDVQLTVYHEVSEKLFEFEVDCFVCDV
jgi:hypothetical protein